MCWRCRCIRPPRAPRCWRCCPASARSAAGLGQREPRISRSLAESMLQKGFALAQHLRAGVRIIELMIQIVPRHELVRDTRTLQALRHVAGLVDGDVAI